MIELTKQELMAVDIAVSHQMERTDIAKHFRSTLRQAIDKIKAQQKQIKNLNAHAAMITMVTK